MRHEVQDIKGLLKLIKMEALRNIIFALNSTIPKVMEVFYFYPFQQICNVYLLC